jgi:deoxyxylulose-5-phosphate synthase
VGVIDMPSIDEDLLMRLYDSGKMLCFAEQNNGYIWRNFLRILARQKKKCDWDRLLAINTLARNGQPQFIHSGTYEELLEAFHLSPSHLVRTITQHLTGRKL